MKQLFTFLFLPFWVSAGAQATLSTYRTVSGTVEDENGNSIQNAWVRFNHPVYGLQVETRADGGFIFERIGSEIDFGAYYTFSFRKPGFEPLEQDRLLNDSRPIRMKRSKSGYIQVLDAQSGKLLSGVSAGAQDPSVKCTPSDKYGFIRIDLPASLQEDQLLGIAISGDLNYRDTTIFCNVSQFRNTILIVKLSARTINYPVLKKDLEQYYNNVRNDPGNSMWIEKFIRTFEHTDRARKSSGDRQDWLQQRTRYEEVYGLLIKVANPVTGNPCLNEYQSKYNEFDRLWEKVENEQDVERRLQGLDRLFYLGLDILDIELELFQTLNENKFFLRDAPFINDLLQDEGKFIREARARKDISREVYESRELVLKEKANAFQRRLDSYINMI